MEIIVGWLIAFGLLDYIETQCSKKLTFFDKFYFVLLGWVTVGLVLGDIACESKSKKDS